jgi:hypothetical protein
VSEVPGTIPPAEPTAASPSLRDRFTSLRLFGRRHRVGLLLAIALLALVIGFGIGRATGEGPEPAARRAIEVSVLPLALDADAIWTSGADGGPPVSEALVALRRDGDPRVITEHQDRWLAAYDAALVRMAGLDLPPSARPVQRQFMAAVTLSRDAVEVLGHAALTDDALARRDLTTEVGRLRMRSEQLTQVARASTTDLAGDRADVSPLPDVISFLDGRTR